MILKGNYKNIPNPNEDYYKDSILVEGDNSRLAMLIKKANAGENITIVGLGGSITQGNNESTYGHLVTNWFQNTYKDIEVVYINAGIGATGSIWGVERIHRDVLSYNPDLVFVEFSVNDSDTPYEKEAYESMLRKILVYESKPAVLHIANVRYDIFTKTGNNVQGMHAEICANYDVPIISMKDGVYGKLEWSEYIPDTIHPNDFGHEIIGSLIMMKLADISANLNTFGEPDYLIPEPVTKNGFKDCIYLSAKDINIESLGSWKLSSELICNTSNGESLVIKTNYSYMLLRYIAKPEGNAKIKIVIDGNSLNVKYVENSSGFFFHLVIDAVYISEPGSHRVEITMEDGSEFIIVGIYASNFDMPLTDL